MTKTIDDERDAELILAVAQRLSDFEGMGMSASWVNRAMREALKTTWEGPRRGPIIGSQYPVRVPWSEAARDRVRENGDKVPAGELVLEHVVPVGVTGRQLLEKAQTLTAAGVADLLRSQLVHAVILKREEPKFTYDSDRRWSRYTDGEFPDGYEPLEPAS